MGRLAPPPKTYPALNPNPRLTPNPNYITLTN